jgi:hypothetical protein
MACMIWPELLKEKQGLKVKIRQGQKTDSVCVSMMNRKTRLQPPFQSGACGE